MSSDVVFYQYHDIRNRRIGQVTDFDRKTLETMARAGFTFTATLRDGTEREVPVDEVTKPPRRGPVDIDTGTAQIKARLDAVSVVLTQLTNAVIEVNPKSKAALQAAAVKLSKLSTDEEENI